MKKHLLFLMVILVSLSCSETTQNISQSELLGEWRSENSFINEKPASIYLNGNDLYSSILGFKEDNFYYLDFSAGEWSIEENILTLSNQGQFEILAYSDSLMTLKGEILAGQLYWNLEGISDEETITLQEDFRRR